MSRLFMLLLSISVGTLAGIGVIVALVMGRYDYTGIIAGAVIGAVLALPVTWVVSRRIEAAEDVQDR